MTVERGRDDSPWGWRLLRWRMAATTGGAWALLTALAACHVYLLTGTMSDPRKTGATFRAVQRPRHMTHYLRLRHHVTALNYLIYTFDKLKHVFKVFESRAKADARLKCSAIYIHGGGWAVAARWRRRRRAAASGRGSGSGRGRRVPVRPMRPAPETTLQRKRRRYQLYGLVLQKPL